MDIDGIERCPRCFSPWDQNTCPACGYKEEEENPAACRLEQETILQGRYLIGALLGTGGFGITYAAWDLKLDTQVAIKEYFPSVLASRDISATDEVETKPGEGNAHAFAIGLNRFIREARMLALFNTHADIVAVRDCIEENNTAYIVMEYLRGTNLQAYAVGNGGRVPAKALIPMMRAPMEALGKIHETGMLHRDVSPSNLMLEPEGRVKLIDFGAAMDCAGADTEQNEAMILNRRYAAPEQFQADGELGPWTDVYGICATLYTLLTGKTPCEAARAGAVPPLRAQGVNMTRRQERAILRGLAENPKERVQSIPELMSPLYGVPLPEEIRRRKRLVRRAVSAVCAMVLLSLVALVNAFWGFPGGDGAYYRIESDGASLIRYGGNSATFSNRTRFLGVPVRRIGALAFSDHETLTEVIISEGVRYAGDFAFAGCENLRTVVVPSALTFMSGVFDRCDEQLTLYGAMGTTAHHYAHAEGLRFSDPSVFEVMVLGGEATLHALSARADDFYDEIVVPSTLAGAPVTVIDTQEGYVPSVRRIILPDTVRRIAPNAFGWSHTDPDGWHDELEEVLLPEGLESIGEGAFQSSGLRSLIIPNTVTSIGRSAFTDCPLTSVGLPSSLADLGAWAFGACRLTEIRLPDRLAMIEEYTFYGCKELTSVVLPAGLRSIDKHAFENCAGIREILVPNGTQSIGDEAFRNCYQLARVIIPESTTSIGTDALRGCAPDLTIYGLKGSAAEAYARANGIRFADMGAWTAEEAFVYEIKEEGVFLTAYSGEFQDVVIPAYMEGVAVTALAEELFADAVNLRSVEVPNTVSVLPSGLFYGCASLVSVALPEGLRAIETDVFHGCTALQALTIPSTVSTISVLAFVNAESLETLAFQEGTRRIDMLGEETMKEVMIPASVISIASDSFKWVKTTLTIRGARGSYAEAWARENGIAFVGME